MVPAASRWRALISSRPAIAAGIAATAILVATLVPAAAAPAADDPVPTSVAAATATPPTARNPDQRLEKLFQQEQAGLARLQKALQRAGDVVAKARGRIDALKGKGQDTSEQEAALAAFKTAIASARGGYDSAKATLDARAGFDSDGKVTDPAQARTTLESAPAAMRQALQSLRQGGEDLLAARRAVALDRRFATEQRQLGKLQTRLTQAGKVATRAQTFIDGQKAKGKDTSTLESAVADFNAAVASAQGSYDSAKSTLDARAGFDSAGKVTDQAQARSTLDTAAKAIRQAGQTLRQALAALQKGIREFRGANKA